MKRSYKVLTEIYQQQVMQEKEEYDWEKEGIELDGKKYDVKCNFDFKREAISHRHDPRADRGQDIYAMMPYKVLDMKVFAVEPNGEPGPEVTDLDVLEQVAKLALEMAREQAIDDSEKEFGELM